MELESDVDWICDLVGDGVTTFHKFRHVLLRDLSYNITFENFVDTAIRWPGLIRD